MTAIGMNLTSVNYYSNQDPFIDRFKTSANWTASDVSFHAVTTPLTLDKNGNLAGLPSNVAHIGIAVGLDPVAAVTTDRYVITYSGSGNVSVLGGTIVSSEAGKIVFDFTSKDQNFAFINVDVTDRTNLIHDIHVVREDQVGLFNSGELFNPDFTAKISNWDTLRFMDWGNTNVLAPATWSTRNTEASASWADNAGGVPIEVMVKLANETHKNMWFNIPTEADDNYVRQAMTYIRDHLDPSLKVNVEYSNEMWNWGFGASHYAQDQGNLLWGKDANGDGKIDNSDPNENYGPGSIEYYGYRSAQIASIAKSVFVGESSNRLEDIISTQTAYTGLEKYVFDGVQKAGLGSVATLFNEYAITTYFGGSLDGYDSDADRQTILGWARSGSPGLTAAFNELQHGGALSSNSSLDALVKTLAYQAAVAKTNGLDLVAYEGGAHLNAGGFSADVEPEITAFVGRMMSDPRMGDLYTKMVNEFADVGGTELTAFSDVGTNGKYGYWGVLDDIYQTSSPRYDALVAAAGINLHAAGTSPLHPVALPLPGPVIPNPVEDPIAAPSRPPLSVTTDQAGFTLDATTVNLTFAGTGGFYGTGNALDNVITGGDGGGGLRGAGGNDTLIAGIGNDDLDGGVGADLMKGGKGDDSYHVDNAGDIVVENANEGRDQVFASITYTLPDNVEQLILTGNGAIDGSGNGLDNVLTGNSGANHLFGYDGNDTLSGGAGNDTIDGGAGNDSLFGQDGNDTLVGGLGADMLDGGTGADVMKGGVGNDWYVVDNVGDQVIELDGEGQDAVASSVNYTLGANVDDLVLTGAAKKGTGNELDNHLTNNNASGSSALNGMDGNDTLDGGRGADTLNGGSGNDTLRGGAGNDILTGGTGADLLSGGTGADRFVFAPGDIPNSGNTDFIIDFSRAEGDKLDFSQYRTSTHTPLHFIGTGNFSHSVGEVRIVASPGSLDIQGDVNGDGIADFHLILGSVTTLAKSDFVF